MKMCEMCKDQEATEEGDLCFICWEEGNYLAAEILAELN